MDSNLEWIQWGKRDPLYAVAVWEGRQRHGPNPWTDEEFYELGRSDWQDFLTRWERYGLTHESCLEIGCGAGRLTKQIAMAFEGVHAVDVSPEMIEYARQRVGAENVDFALTDGVTLPLAGGSVGAVFSAHVFQHLDSPEQGEQCFREAHRVLTPGGTMMVHVPLQSTPTSGRLVRAALKIERMKHDLSAARARRRIRRGEDVELMRFMSYEARWLQGILAALGYCDLELCSFPVASNGAWHTFVLGRKPVPT